MAKPWHLALLASAALVTVFAAVWVSVAWSAAAASPLLTRGAVVPGIARDGVAVPTPTLSPQPRAGQRLKIDVVMVMNEGSIQGGGFVPLTFRGGVEGPVPSPGAQVSYHGAATIDPHPIDALNHCEWNVAGFPVMGIDATVATYTTLIPFKTTWVMNFTAPSWHYDVVCKGEGGFETKVRIPAGNANRSLPGWLGLILPGRAGEDGMELELPEYTGNDPNAQECIYNRAVVTGSNAQGSVTITIDIVGPKPVILPTVFCP